MPDNVEMLRPGIRRYTESFSMWRINRSRAYLVEGGAREVSYQSVSAVRLVLHYALNDHLITSQHHAAMVVNRCYTKAETTILQECVQYWFGPLDPSEDHQVEKSPKRERGWGEGARRILQLARSRSLGRTWSGTFSYPYTVRYIPYFLLVPEGSFSFSLSLRNNKSLIAEQ